MEVWAQVQRTRTNSIGDGSPADRETVTPREGKPLGTTLTDDGRRGLDMDKEDMVTGRQGSQLVKRKAVEGDKPG
jgi:hypothetical protein